MSENKVLSKELNNVIGQLQNQEKSLSINLYDFTKLLLNKKNEVSNNGYKIKPYLQIPLIYEILPSKDDLINMNYKDYCLFEPVYDSRKANFKTTFIAISGSVTDGHNFIINAINNGCNTIVCEFIPETINLKSLERNVIFIITNNSRKFMSFLSHCLFDFPTEKLNVFAVTGTNGKTTTTFILKSFLENKIILNDGELGNDNLDGSNLVINKQKVGIIGTTGIYYDNKKIETNHTTPESIDLCKILNDMILAGVEVVIMETSSHSLHQYRVANFHFRGAIFTNLTLDHLDYHKTMNEYAKAKKILFDYLPQSSIAVVNSNDEYSEFMISETQSGVINKLHFQDFEKDIYNINYNEINETEINTQILNNQIVFNQKLSLQNLSFDFLFNNKQNDKLSINTELIGRFNIYNLALSLSLYLSYLTKIAPNIDIYSNDFRNIIDVTISKLQVAKGRMERYNLKNNAFAIIDYAHTPDSLEKALQTLIEIKETNPQTEIIVVFGCGGDRDKTKRPIMGDIASKLADKVIITDDNPRTESNIQIVEEIYSGIESKYKNKVKIIHDRKEAIEAAIILSKAEDLILIAGKGHEDYQIIGTEKIHLSDEEEVLKFV